MHLNHIGISLSTYKWVTILCSCPAQIASDPFLYGYLTHMDVVILQLLDVTYELFWYNTWMKFSKVVIYAPADSGDGDRMPNFIQHFLDLW
jgi:hypothetical protein